RRPVSARWPHFAGPRFSKSMTGSGSSSTSTFPNRCNLKNQEELSGDGCPTRPYSEQVREGRAKPLARDVLQLLYRYPLQKKSIVIVVPTTITNVRTTHCGNFCA